jgi:hypothetical protein
VPRQPRRLIIPAWVPAAARQAIEDLSQDPLDETARAALKRLATYPAMYTEVWEKLQGEPESAAGELVRCAVVAIMVFPILRPMPKTQRHSAWKRWDQFRRKHLKHALGLPHETHAYFAAELGDTVRTISDASWAHHWQGLDRARMVSDLDAAARAFQSMGAESEAMLTALQFPEVHRWDDPRAAEVFFSKWMSKLLSNFYGRPCDPVVAALTAVVFDHEDVAPNTVRWRRLSSRKHTVGRRRRSKPRKRHLR